MTCRLSLASAFLLVIASSPAAADENLTLKGALERAIEGNIDLRRERVNIASANAGVLANKGTYDLSVLGGATYSSTTTPRRNATDVTGGTSDRFNYNFGLARNLETGGNLSLTWTGSSAHTDQFFLCGDGMDPTATCDIHDANLALKFNHPLLRGFGPEIAQANLRKARVQGDLALMNRQTRAGNVVRDVTIGYWELSYATQELAILRSAVELARDQLKFVKAQIGVGRAAPLEAAAAERAIAEREQAVAVSEQALFFRTLDLRRQFGVAADAASDNFVAQDVPQAAPHEVDAKAELAKALDNNPQLKALRAGLKLNDIDVRTAESQLLPQVDFEGSLASAGRKNALSDTVSQTTGLEAVSWSAGLSFQLPIPNRGARGNAEVTRQQRELARLGVTDFELVVKDSVIRTSSAVKTASRRLDLSRAAAGFAEKDLEAEKARFNVGRSTNTEILRKQQELKSAQIQIVRATVDLLNAEAQLQTLTGELLERYGIALKGL